MLKDDEWHENIEKELEIAKERCQVPDSFVELVSKLLIRQSELEMQNDELRESQEVFSRLYNQYHELYDELPVGYFTLDKNGIIGDVNVKGAEILQLKKNQIIGRGFSKFILKNYESMYFQSLADASDTCENQKLELQLKRDKSFFYAYIEITPLYELDNENYRIVITDINESKKTEEELKENEKILSIELEAAKNLHQISLKLIHAKDIETLYDQILETLITILNADCASIQRFYPERGTNGELYLLGHRGFNGQAAKFWKWVCPDSKSTCGIALSTRQRVAVSDVKNSELIAGSEDQKTYLQTGIHAVQTTPLISRSGILLGMFSSHWLEPHELTESETRSLDILARQAADLIENKWAEEKLKEAHDNLEEQVQKRTEELNVLIKELKRSNEELQQFAHVSSHDLQEPLRTIASFTQLLKRRYKGKLDNDADEFIDYIVGAAFHMKAQIEALLEYSRVTTNGVELKLVDTMDIVNKAINGLYNSIEESNTEITVDELPNIVGNAVQLERVFQNLISNAIKFRKYEEPLKIYISAYKSEDGKEYVFSVKDNGIGIEEQYFERIFTIFQRLHTINEYHGTGIGLSIIKRIIEWHDGYVWVESEFGIGSTFYFTIPIDETKN